jgi:type I restriction enzyme S subunit
MAISNDELPQGWLSCSLGDVVEYGKTAKAEPFEIAKSAWILELEDIEKDTSRLLEHRTFAERQSKSTKNSFEEGDVLYGKLRPYLNKVIVADQPGYCTTEIIPLKPNAALDGRFLFYWLKHPVFLDYVRNVSHGLNMPRLGTDAGKAAPFRLAPLAEQKRIADKLDAVLRRVDACRARLDGAPEILKGFRQSVIGVAASGQLTEDWRGAQVRDWSAQSLGHIAKFIDYRGKTPRKTQSGLPLITAKNVRAGYVSPEPREFIAPDAYDVWMTRGIPRRGDVLITTEAPLGNVAVIDWDYKFALAQRIICLQFNDKECDGRYAAIALQDPLFQARLRERSTGTTVEGIKASRLKELTINIPRLDEQEEVIRRVQALLALAERIETCITRARAQIGGLTPAALTKAFRGDLVPQDPNDEPASVLLERLQTARKTESARRLQRHKTPHKRIMKTSTKESVTGAIRSMNKDKFSFSELREKVGDDYEALTEAVFHLLAEQNPVLKQVFNTRAKIMQFQRFKR